MGPRKELAMVKCPVCKKHRPSLRKLAQHVEKDHGKAALALQIRARMRVFRNQTKALKKSVKKRGRKPVATPSPTAPKPTPQVYVAPPTIEDSRKAAVTALQALYHQHHAEAMRYGKMLQDLRAPLSETRSNA